MRVKHQSGDQMDNSHKRWKTNDAKRMYLRDCQSTWGLEDLLAFAYWKTVSSWVTSNITAQVIQSLPLAFQVGGQQQHLTTPGLESSSFVRELLVFTKSNSRREAPSIHRSKGLQRQNPGNNISACAWNKNAKSGPQHLEHYSDHLHTYKLQPWGPRLGQHFSPRQVGIPLRTPTAPHVVL